MQRIAGERPSQPLRDVTRPWSVALVLMLVVPGACYGLLYLELGTILQSQPRDGGGADLTGLLATVRWMIAAHVALAVGIGAAIAALMARRIREEMQQRDAAHALLAAHAREVERSRAEAELARLDAECARAAAWTLVAIVESSGDAVVGLTPDGAITSWNGAAERLYGHEREDVLGRPLVALFGAEVATALERVRSGEDVVRFETKRRHRAGTAVHVAVTVSAVKDSTGTLIGASSIDRDIRERCRVEEELARRAAELSRSNRELEQFAYVASHDLQEPLRMVGSYVQLIARRYAGRLDDEADEFIGYAVDGAKRMRALIDDLLELSRVGSRGIESETVDCEEMLADAIANLSLSVAETGTTITHDPLPRLVGDQSLLVQVFQNLIGNAIKFRSDAPPRVHVAVERGERAWTFAVRDNGIGIDPAHQERIFQIFQRLHTREQYPGTGIGLALCRKIVERHDGTIWVASALGRGSTFYVTLPIADEGLGAPAAGDDGNGGRRIEEPRGTPSA